MLKLLMTDSRFRGLRAIIILFGLLSVATFFYKTIIFTCQISVLQNILLPIIVVQQYISKMDWMPLTYRIRVGVKLGGIVGASIAVFFLLVQNIQYYFFEGREIAYSALGSEITGFTLQTLYLDISTDLFILFGLTILSIISGIIASMFVIIVRPNKPTE